ncbi:MAG: TlpA disulfide reductase family protein [Shinella sp.]|nr:TlpA disulfide reductase family protein [Shinella sp.]
MSVKKTLGLPAARLIAVAGIAGLLAGAAAIYVMESRSGNGTALSETDNAACADTGETAKRLDPLFKGEVAAMMSVPEHRQLPALAFNGPDGKAKSLSDFSGKTLLVNLWATWCVPCREEMPALNALQKSMGGDRFEVVAINIDTGSDEKPKAFLDETGVHDLGYYRDASMGVFNTLKKEGLAFGLPVTLLMDDKGCLVSAMNGPAAWDSEDAKALIGAATTGRPAS